MFFQALFACSLVAVANSCGPGSAPSSGKLRKNPTFKLSFAPPISWTFYTKNSANSLVPYPGQTATQAAALQNVKQAVDNAIFTALQRVGYSPVGWSWTISGYDPTPISVVPDSDTANALAGTYVASLNTASTVISIRKGSVPFTKVNNVNSLAVTVKGPTSYHESVWRALADEVFTLLATKSGVKFWSDIIIS